MIAAHGAYFWGLPQINYSLFWWVYPVFAGLVGVNAYARSSNPFAYSLRLLQWGLISQPVYMWAFERPWWIPNMLIGLSVVAFAVGLHRDEQASRMLSKIPSWIFYAIYPAHIFIFKLLSSGAVSGPQ